MYVVLWNDWFLFRLSNVCILSLKQLLKSEMIHIRIRGYRRVSEMDFTEYFLTINLKAWYFEINYLLEILPLNLYCGFFKKIARQDWSLRTFLKCKFERHQWLLKTVMETNFTFKVLQTNLLACMYILLSCLNTLKVFEAILIKWNQDVVDVYLPFLLIQRVINKIQKDRTRLILIAPP